MLLQPDPEASCIEDGWQLQLILQGKQIRIAAHQQLLAGGECLDKKHPIHAMATSC